MFKFVFPAVVCVAMCFPMIAAAQDCGNCDPAPTCVKTRKKLVLVNVQKERCRLKMACVTDECGCTKKKLVRVKECVTRKRPAIIDVAVDPCKKNCFAKMADRIGGLKARLAKPCCDAPATCGCGCN